MGTVPEQEKFEQHRHWLESLTTEEAERYFAERQEADRQAELRHRRREHFLHQLGIAMMWLATVVFAFSVGYSQGRSLHATAANILDWGTLGGFFGGLWLMGMNRHRRDD